MRARRAHDEGDAWDAVVTGQAPSARRLRGDPEIRAQWDEARQVESRLRQGLGLLAEEARMQETQKTDMDTETVHGDAGAPAAGAARRWRRAALVVAAAVVVGLGAAAVGLQPWSGDDGGSEQGTASLSGRGLLACAEVVAQGQVDEVEAVSGGRVELRMTVGEYLKPRKDPGGRLEVTTQGRAELRAGIEAAVVVYPDRADASVYPGEQGTRLLSQLRPYAAEPDTLPRCEGSG
ncbi:hypothetical protein [Streptomyces lanatus]|uniref:Uncharacterized protein n=1 Tax=Streptomyces lanatus TaxID=66900 RepID=A0ABV1Y755_9ACTN|nr:hypothetical protein [Streptomyces lanatus]GHH29902.1 hypothetical protein GCM10018780_88570 [Streptomyces lanatus]